MDTQRLMMTFNENPRSLTEEEQKIIMDMMDHRLKTEGPKLLKGLFLRVGDQIVYTHTIHVGPKKTETESIEGKCNVIHPTMGFQCRLDKGHVCQHSYIHRW